MSKKARPLSASVMVTLGLTGVLNTAVNCGPCLEYLPEDSGVDTDTGEGHDTGDTASEDASADAQGRAAVTEQVLARGVLPEDVAKLLAKQKNDEESD